MPRHRITTIFSGPLITIRDVCCREPAGPCAGEERATADQVVFTRAGVFVRHSATSHRREIVADPLRVLLFRKDEPFRVSHPVEGGDDCTMFAFSSGAVRDVARLCHPGRLDRFDPFAVAQAPLTLAAIARYRAVRATLRRRASETLSVEEEGVTLLAEVVGAAHGSLPPGAREGTRRQRRDLVERTREVLASAPGEPWTLSALARRVYSSPFHLTRVFRQHTGRPVHRFLLQLRLAAALERLEEGERDLTTVALDLGFSSHSHFTTSFKSAFGVTPSAFRRHARTVVTELASTTSVIKQGLQQPHPQSLRSQ